MKHAFRRRKTLSDSSSSIDEITANEASPLAVKQEQETNMIPSTSIPPFVVRATAIASLGGILFGYDMGVISGALPQLTATFELTQTQQQLVVGILYLGGGIGAAVGGSLCDGMGRKTAILLTDVVFAIGAAILACATRVSHVVIGRIVMGFGIAVSGIADVAYLNEMAPLEWRGSIVSVNEACISLGFLFAYVVGYVFSFTENGWRSMFGLSGLVAVGQLLGMLTMPESPLWLKEKGRIEESHEALKIIYGQEGIPVEESHHGTLSTSSSTQNLVDQSYASLPSLQKELSPTSSSIRESTIPSCRLLAFTVRNHKQAWIALFLSVAQQMSGQTNVMNYAPLIFGQFNQSIALTSTLWIGIVKFMTTVLVIWKIEYMGRRNLLLAGMSLIVLGLLMLTLAFVAGNDLNEDGEMVPSNRGMYLALPGVLCVVTGYSASFGPLTWLLTSELFCTDIRGRALGASTIVTYLCACLATSTFLTASSWFGGYVFLLYAAFTFAGLVFAYLAIPDTAGKTVNEIDEELLSMWWWRRENYNMVDSTHSDRPVLEAELT